MKVHLISMPYTLAHYTSIQTGCLKSYLDSRFKGNKELKVRTYSAHLSVQLRAFGASYDDKKTVYEGRGELLWFTILLRRFNFIKKKNYRSLVLKLTKRIDKLCKTKGTNNVVSRLDRATVDFINEDLAPNLSKKELNIVGFSLTNEQLYASLYCYLYLLKHYPEYRMLFVFGGGITSWPGILKVLKKFDVKGLVVIGEGEVKLEKIIKACLKGEVSKLDKINDVYYVSKLTDEDIFKLRPTEGSQLKSIEDLPLPDYTEYFNTLREYCEDEDTYLELKKYVKVLLYGSRGCFWGRCAFCGIHSCWHSYRQKSSKNIHDHITRALIQYPSANIQFVDSSCNLWWKGCCDLLLENNQLSDLFLQFRAGPEEVFYTKLSLTGCRMVQIGIEALSDSLLKKMNKGVNLITNIQAMKYLAEVNIVNLANLIVKHPYSSAKEADETKELLLTLAHIGSKMTLSHYVLSPYSPIYDDITDYDKKALTPQRMIKMTEDLSAFFAYHTQLPPSKRISIDARKAWNDFCAWHEEWDKAGLYLNVSRLSRDSILIEDNRFGSTREYIYSSNEEQIYTMCHSMMSLQNISKKAGIKEKETKKILDDFISKRLMVYSNDKYLSIALRPRNELINNYFVFELENSKRCQRKQRTN